MGLSILILGFKGLNYCTQFVLKEALSRGCQVFVCFLFSFFTVSFFKYNAN